MAPQGLRHQFHVAFSLMAVIPLLVLVYLTVTYLPRTRTTWDIGLIIALCGLIAGLGYLVARDLILPILAVAHDARRLAAGQHLERDLPVTRPDEIGELNEALNHINQRIRDHMVQLNQYGEQVKQLNTEIHKRVLALSNLLQVSNLMTQGAALDEVLDCCMEKLAQIEESDLYALLVPGDQAEAFCLQMAHGSNPQQVARLRGTTVRSAWLAQCARQMPAVVTVDAGHPLVLEAGELQRLFGLTNAVVVPVISRGRCLALVVTGHRQAHFTFPEDVLETTKVFAKQIAIAMENDLLMKQAKALAVTDEVTGVYNDQYLRARLEEEVRRAAMFHHACSLVLVNVDDFGRVAQAYGQLASEEVLRQVAQTLQQQVTAIDKVARLQGDQFGIILPERTKREAIELAETLRHAVEAMRVAVDHGVFSDRITISVGVSENPLDGATAVELIEKGEQALQLAKRQGKNRIVAC